MRLWLLNHNSALPCFALWMWTTCLLWQLTSCKTVLNWLLVRQGIWESVKAGRKTGETFSFFLAVSPTPNLSSQLGPSSDFFGISRTSLSALPQRAGSSLSSSSERCSPSPWRMRNPNFSPFTPQTEGRQLIPATTSGVPLCFGAGLGSVTGA